MVILHRIGRLLVGEASVAIGVSAAHRQEAFEACQYAIDTVKQIAPIWKRELFVPFLIFGLALLLVERALRWTRFAEALE